jgi:phospholipid transport system substrate-binding protein
MIDPGRTWISRVQRTRSFLATVLCATLALSLGARAQAAEPAAPAAKAAIKKGAKPEAAAVGKGPATPPADSSPLADLKKSNATLKKVLQKAPGNERDTRAGEVRKVVGQFLDFEELSRRALARHWDAITPKQRTEFVGTLRDLVERNYIKQIHGQPDYDLRFEKETKEGTDATVTATLVTTSPKGKKVNVALEYKMVWKNGRWVVYDVVTDEQSLLENYRAEFNKIIAKDGFDALVKRMRKKLEEKTE